VPPTTSYYPGNQGILPNLPLSNNPQISYLHSWSIVNTDNSGIDATSELQIVNGQVCAPGARKGYLNYTSYYYATASQNTVNYSSLTSSTPDYRFATFAWKFPIRFSTFNAFTFIINNFTSLTINPSMSQILDTSGNPVYLYYMFVDSTDSTTINAFNSDDKTTCTSTWINAGVKAVGASQLNSSNYNNGTVYNAMQPGSTTYTGNILTLPVITPGVRPPNTNVTLYLRIGLKMSSPAAFGSVFAQYI
jgi:hypothetical protein